MSFFCSYHPAGGHHSARGRTLGAVLRAQHDPPRDQGPQREPPRFLPPGQDDRSRAPARHQRDHADAELAPGRVVHHVLLQAEPVGRRRGGGGLPQQRGRRM